MTPNNTDEDEKYRDITDNPFVEQDILDAHEEDMMGALFDPDQTPKPPDGTAEPQSVGANDHPVDMQTDSPLVDVIDFDVLSSPIGGVNIAELEALDVEVEEDL